MFASIALKYFSLGILLGSFFLASSLGAQEEFVVRVATLYTGTTGDLGVFQPGELWVKAGKIVQVGSALSNLPAEIPRLDYPSLTLLPGFVCSAGLSTHEGKESPYSFNGGQVAVDGAELFQESRFLLRAGITTAYYAPGDSRFLNGWGSVLKTAGVPPQRLVSTKQDLHFSLGKKTLEPPLFFEPPLPATPIDPISPRQQQFPQTPMAVLSALKDLRYLSQRPPQILPLFKKIPPDLQSFFQGSLRLRFQVEDAFYLHHLKRLFDQGPYPFVFERFEERLPVDKELVQIPQILKFREAWNSTTSLQDYVFLRTLNFCLAPATPAQVGDLLRSALQYQKVGMTLSECCALITSKPAQFLGIEDRVGSLEPGKSADFVLIEGALNERNHAISRVFLEGALVYEQPKIEFAPLSSFGQKKMVLLRQGKLHTVSQGSFIGDLLIGEGKIWRIGTHLDAPPGVSILDLQGKVVLPGWIDPLTFLGRPERFLTAEERKTSEEYADQEALAECFLESPDFQTLAKQGITTVGLSSPRWGTLSGTGALVKTAGKERVLARRGLYFCSVARSHPIESAKRIQAFVKAAREYQKQKEEYPQKRQAYLDYLGQKEIPKEEKPKEPQAPPYQSSYEQFNQFEREKGVMLCEASTLLELRAVLRYLVQESALKLVVFPAKEAAWIASELAEKQVGVLLKDTGEYWREGKRYSLFIELKQAGVFVAFASFAGQANRLLNFHLDEVPSLDTFTVLKSVTLDPARLLGIENYVGSLEVGKSADLFILTQEPFRTDTQVDSVYIQGVKVEF